MYWHGDVSILVSVDSVLEDFTNICGIVNGCTCFNPSFCGFGIGG